MKFAAGCLVLAAFVIAAVMAAGTVYAIPVAVAAVVVVFLADRVEDNRYRRLTALERFERRQRA